MSILRSHLNKISLEDLAIPSNIKYGKAIHMRKVVSVIQETEAEVEAWAGGLTGTVTEGGGSKRKVQLWLKDSELHWHCTGNPKNHDIFCKHCVAVALFLTQEKGNELT